MSDQVSWLDAAYSRDSDPNTSHEAAKSITSDALRQNQADVMALFRLYGPMIDLDLIHHAHEHALPQSHSGLRTRRSELVKLGKLRFSEMYKTIGKRRHRVWERV